MTDPQTTKNAIIRAEQSRRPIEETRADSAATPHSADRELQLIELTRQASEADARLAHLIDEAAQAAGTSPQQNRE